MQAAAWVSTDANLLCADATSPPTTPPGQLLFGEPGIYTWTAPAGITNVSVVCVGAGGGTGTWDPAQWKGGAAGAGGESGARNSQQQRAGHPPDQL
jgi:hypothetical protein